MQVQWLLEIIRKLMNLWLLITLLTLNHQKRSFSIWILRWSQVLTQQASRVHGKVWTHIQRDTRWPTTTLRNKSWPQSHSRQVTMEQRVRKSISMQNVLKVRIPYNFTSTETSKEPKIKFSTMSKKMHSYNNLQM